jgi:hypothetical protein
MEDFNFDNNFEAREFDINNLDGKEVKLGVMDSGGVKVIYGMDLHNGNIYIIASWENM